MQDELATIDVSPLDALGRIKQELDTLERGDDLHVPGAMWLVDALELAFDEQRDAGVVFGELVFEPADSQIAAKRVAGIKIGTNDRRFKIEAKLHAAILLLLADRHERHLRVFEVERHSIVPEEVAAEDPGLFEAGCLIDRVQIQSYRGDTLSRVLSKTDAG